MYLAPCDRLVCSIFLYDASNLPAISALPAVSDLSVMSVFPVRTRLRPVAFLIPLQIVQRKKLFPVGLAGGKLYYARENIAGSLLHPVGQSIHQSEDPKSQGGILVDCPGGYKQYYQIDAAAQEVRPYIIAQMLGDQPVFLLNIGVCHGAPAGFQVISQLIVANLLDAMV